MIVEPEQKEEVKRNHSKFIPRLSQEEKDLIERISGITGYKFNTVKDIFLALSVVYGMDLNDKAEIAIPYLFKVKTGFDEDLRSGKRTLLPRFVVEPFYALKNVVEKMGREDGTWLHEYFKVQIRNLVSKTLDIKDEQ